MSASAQIETEVAVIGAGPAGLATAIELGRRGIKTVVVEQQLEIGQGHPRAAQIQVRTMEFFRRWGITKRLREESLLPPGFGPTVSFATSLTDKNIATVPFFAVTGGAPGTISAEEGGWAPQFHFTQVMEDLARSLPSVEILRGWRYVSLSEDPDGVTAELEQIRGRDRRTVHAAFLVGADGGHGAVRRDVGIDYQGVPELSFWLYIPFRAPELIDTMTIDKSVMYFLFTPSGTMVVRPITRERWDIQLAAFDPSTDVASLDLQSIARAAIGSEMNCTIGTPAVIALHDLIADRYRQDRVLLVGDAAHLIVHYGGHNGNTGIADGVNLGWKLAAMLSGWGAAGLLDSYESERRPAALRTRDTAMASMRESGQAMFEAIRDGVPTGEDPAARNALALLRQKLVAHADMTWQATGVSLDQRYDTSPVVVPDGAAVPDWNPRVLSQVVAVGHRAPHVYEPPDGSIHDAFGPEFTLLRVNYLDGAEALIGAAQDRGVPLKVLDRAGEPYEAAYGSALTLIRPDAQIAWRGDAAPPDPAAVIDVVRGAAPISSPGGAARVRASTRAIG